MSEVEHSYALDADKQILILHRRQVNINQSMRRNVIVCNGQCSRKTMTMRKFITDMHFVLKTCRVVEKRDIKRRGCAVVQVVKYIGRDQSGILSLGDKFF